MGRHWHPQHDSPIQWATGHWAEDIEGSEPPVALSDLYLRIAVAVGESMPIAVTAGPTMTFLTTARED